MDKCKFYKNDICTLYNSPCYNEYGDDCLDFDSNIEFADINPEDIDLDQTCFACPEQYDATAKGMINVAYLRLRYGHFCVKCPDVKGEIVYYSDIGDGWTGAFESDKQREFHLNAAKKAIAEYLNSHKELLSP